MIDPMPRQDLAIPPPVGFVTVEYHNAELAVERAKLAKAQADERAKVLAEVRGMVIDILRHDRGALLPVVAERLISVEENLLERMETLK